MSHTPGPWIIDWDIRPDIVTENRKGGYFGEGHLATISKYENGDDARLIAAAPDLLAALEAVEWINRNGYRYCPWCQGVKEDSGHSNACQRQVTLAKVKAE